MARESEEILRRFRRLRSERDGYWRALWRDVRRHCMPDADADAPEGSTANQSRLYDTTAIEARDRLASGMYTWMAPGDRKWFRLTSAGEDKPNSQAEAWFSEATDALTNALNRSNFHGELLKALNDLACGIDCVLYCEDDNGAPSFRCFPIESVCYCTDYADKLDTVFHEAPMTSRQISDRFGNDPEATVPSEILDEASDQTRCDSRHTIIHAVLPRHDRRPDAVGVQRMRYKDYFIEEKSGAVIREGGYEEMPYAVCRFRKSSRERHGRGPGIDMLPDIRMLNAMREAFVRSCEFAADPAWLIPDGSLASRNFSRDPGALVFYRPGMGGAAPQPVARGNNPQLDAQVIEGERKRIRDGFYWDVFDPLGDLRNMTAQEATIRNESKLVPFGPIACNIHNDLFSPMLERAFAIIARAGRVPEAPAEVVENGEYRVEFMSRIALAVKRQAALGWLQTESTLQGMIQLNPAIADNFDLDKVTRDIAQSNGCDSSWIVREDRRDQARQQRAEAQQQAQQMEAIQGIASNAGQLGKRPEEGSPLQGILNGAANAAREAQGA